MRLNKITPKLNPLRRDEHGNLSLTRTRKTLNKMARANQGPIIFDPTLTCKDDILEAFQIFTDPDQITNIPTKCPQGRGKPLRNPEHQVYTDGACINNGKVNAQSGSSVWIAPGHPWNKVI